MGVRKWITGKGVREKGWLSQQGMAGGGGLRIKLAQNAVLLWGTRQGLPGQRMDHTESNSCGCGCGKTLATPGWGLTDERHSKHPGHRIMMETVNSPTKPGACRPS